ncbi:ECF transporter S component [Cryobacterium aureum]|uniref:ECF transporter S component n=1 Tax=Cryobacterium aureum TaxID=995037 RepID=UPI0011E4D075|nr:ECF transporter S component [Cryobacterium aureum]
MIGTAIAAIALGPWHGALVGLLTNLLGTLDGNVETLPFVLVNIVGALVWGYGYHHFGGNRGRSRFLLLALTVAVCCTLVATPLTMAVFGGEADHAGDVYASLLTEDGIPLSVAVFMVNLLLSVIDKLLTSYASLLVARPLGDIRVNRTTALTI